ncbi:MAG: 2-hydroxyacyl-CoA dehydratase [Dehalococcoidia bacterium]
MEHSSLTQPFFDLVEERHQYAREWKARTGGKVLGYFCTYVPEELLYGADILPVRIMGGLEPADVSEAHIASMYCPFSRDCLSEGLLGRYDYLDGITITKSCMHIMQTFRSWAQHIPLEFSYFMGMPSLVGGHLAPKYLVTELEGLKKALEGWIGREITDADIDRGMEIVNANRGLLRDMYELRKPDPPLLWGGEAAAVVMSSMVTDKREHNSRLQSLLAGLAQRQDGPKRGSRLMIVGSEIQDLELYDIIEGGGGVVVMDEHCFGSRYFWNQSRPGQDRMGAIADRFIERPRCPLKDVNERVRLGYILNLAQEWKVDGVLLEHQKFCAPHEYDLPHIKRVLEENNIPTFLMEMDMTLHRGAITTRTEAFLEMLELDLV